MVAICRLYQLYHGLVYGKFETNIPIGVNFISGFLAFESITSESNFARMYLVILFELGW